MKLAVTITLMLLAMICFMSAVGTAWVLASLLPDHPRERGGVTGGPGAGEVTELDGVDR